MMRTLLIALLAIASLSAVADDTTRDALHRRPSAPVVAPRCDTIPALGGEVTISGYDKPLNSRRETFHVTSAMPDTITALTITLLYTDTAGRRLHEATRTVSCLIPPYDTRLISIPAWDTQGRYFYIHGKPSRATGVTPFDVSITPKALIINMWGHRKM